MNLRPMYSAVIVKRPSGNRLFLSRNQAEGTGLIYMANSRRWSKLARPFGGEVLHVERADSFDAALDVLKQYKRRAKAEARP